MSALGPGPTEWGAPTGGVGPWAGDLPDDPRYDPVLLRDGDARNVVDAYRYWTREAIIADIDTRRHPLHVAIENFGHDANIGSVVRTANAFAVHTVHIVGRRRWNRRGAMVTDRYQRLCHHDSTTGLLEFAAGAGLTVVAVDNVPGAARLEQTALPRECLLLFGQEGPGITDDARAGAAVTVSIAQFGSTRSINAGVAAGIAMHAWIRQHADLGPAFSAVAGVAGVAVYGPACSSIATFTTGAGGPAATAVAAGPAAADQPRGATVTVRIPGLPAARHHHTLSRAGSRFNGQQAPKAPAHDAQ